MARTPDGRGPLAIGLLVSLAAHAAALAVVSIDVPDLSPARLAMVPVRPADVEPEPPILVVEIRPPGVRLPSAAGGAAADRSEAAPASSADAPAVRLDAPVRLTASTPSRISLAPAAPVTRSPEIVLAAAARDAEPAGEDEASERPSRGIILRADGGAGDGAGSAGAAGPGRSLFPGTGGVATIGPGGDCITPGLVAPGGRSLPGVDRARSIGRGLPGASTGRRNPIRRSGIRR